MFSTKFYKLLLTKNSTQVHPSSTRVSVGENKLFVLRLDILMKNNPKLSVEELTTY
jgi:hypothetical protein